MKTNRVKQQPDKVDQTETKSEVSSIVDCTFNIFC